MTTAFAGQDRPYWDATLETQSRPDWQALQLSLLLRHLAHAYQKSRHYRASFDAAGVHPDQLRHLDDLRRFPFIDKQILRTRQEAAPPWQGSELRLTRFTDCVERDSLNRPDSETPDAPDRLGPWRKVAPAGAA